MNNSSQPDEKQIKAEWTRRGFSFGLWEDPPGQVWEDFQHDTDELFMLVEGEVELVINGVSLHPTIGEEVLIPAHENHTVKNIGASISRWFYGYKK